MIKNKLTNTMTGAKWSIPPAHKTQYKIINPQSNRTYLKNAEILACCLIDLFFTSQYRTRRPPGCCPGAGWATGRCRQSLSRPRRWSRPWRRWGCRRSRYRRRGNQFPDPACLLVSGHTLNQQFVISNRRWLTQFN